MPGIRSSHKKALRALESIANLLCQSHRHEMSIIDPASGKIVEGYSLTVECGRDNVIWTVKIGENCRFRSLMRAREVIVHNSDPKIDSEISFQIDRVWRGEVCHELIRLQSIGRLKKNWWKHPVILSNDQDTSHTNHPPFNNNPQIETGATNLEHQEPKGVIYVICSPLRTDLSPDLFSKVSGSPPSPLYTEGEDADDEDDSGCEAEDKGEGEDEKANKDKDGDVSDKGDEDEDEGEDQDWSEWEGPWR